MQIIATSHLPPKLTVFFKKSLFAKNLSYGGAFVKPSHGPLREAHHLKAPAICSVIRGGVIRYAGDCYLTVGWRKTMPSKHQELTVAVEKSIRELASIHDDIHHHCVRRFDGGGTRRAFVDAGDSVRTAIDQLGVAWASATRARED